ncbi:MAG: hypothetical protein ABSB88_14250 [Bryobacteraceae bacterium]|jgi:hypothetical protein
MAGKWQSIALPPKVKSGAFNAGTMLLLTDGTVLVNNSGGSNTNNGGSEWLRFTPDPVNGYVGGSWGFESDMTNTRLFCASGVLRDGRVFAIGGEVSTAGGDTPLGEIFDPVSNAWSQMTALDKPAAFNYIQGDASSCVLPDGRVIFGALNATSTAIWDPVSSSWTQSGTAFGTKPDTKVGWCNEETWTLLPDGTVLTVNVKVPQSGGSLASAPTSAERYIPSQDIWISTGALPDVLALTNVFDTVTSTSIGVFEIGPAILLPDKTVIAFGATGHTARFTPGSDPTKPGTWVAGPDFPADPSTTVYPAKILTLSDAPACMQPNGRVLVVAGTLYRNTSNGIDFFSQNSQFFEYDPLAPVASSLTLLGTQPPSGATSQDTWTARFLLLPSGQVMLSTEQAQVYIYTPDPAEPSYQPAWQPAIATFPTTLIIGHSYLLTGAGLNGLSQANSYGDDAQMATNYPIVQITDTVSKAVYYLRTQDFSTLGVNVAGAQTASVTVVQGTPPGSYNLVVIANGIPSAPLAVEIGTQDIGFLLQENEFGGGQVAAQINLAGAPAVYQTVLFVAVEGFTLAELGITNAASLLAPGHQPKVTSPLSKMTFSYNGAAEVEDLTYTGPQRVLFPFQVSFTDDSLFQDPTLFPSGVQKASVTITATFKPPAAGQLTAQAVIKLVQTPNPFILHNDPTSTDPTVQQAWYLSMDLRVFQVTAGDHRFGAQVGNSGNAVKDATDYITKVISNLNGDRAVADSLFQAIAENEDDAALSLAPTDGAGNPVYSFALARVHTQDVAPANDVRVFFRMWAAQQTNALYDPNTTYAWRTNPKGEKIPILGVQNDQIITIPFFASPRQDTSSTNSMAAQTDDPNVQAAIAPDPLGAEVHTFFGCWLDINQASQLQFPALVQGDAAGPFTGEGPLLSIQSFARSAHQCLIAEISYDPDPPPTGSDPSNTDKLAQRNLAFVNVPNPGHAASRRVPQTFEIKPSPAVLMSDGRPDELMIHWGNLPKGSSATIYLPAVDSADILDWATRLYTTHRLTAADAHTVQMPIGGVSYVPIPRGGVVNFAGLLTVDLPATVKKGQKFEVVVRQVTSAGGFPGQTQTQGTRTFAAVAQVHPWRTVLGQFNLTIPVSTKHELLGGEERLLSIMRWIGKTIPAESRWYPVFQRYLEQLTGRVTFMGGDPTQVNPSPTGVWKVPYEPGRPGHPQPGGGEHGHDGHGHHDGDHHHHPFVGKVDGLVYDHFGDFDGFVLETRHGHKHRFFSREVRVEERVRRACDERLVTTVVSTEDGREVLSIIFGALE